MNFVSPHFLLLAYTCAIFVVLWAWPGYLFSKERHTIRLAISLAVAGWLVVYLGAKWLSRENGEYLLTATKHGRPVILATLAVLLVFGTPRVLRENQKE